MPNSKNTSSNIERRITCERGPVMLYNSEEAAHYVGLSIMGLFKDGKSPPHYMTWDKLDIYFDQKTLDDIRKRLNFRSKGATNDHE